MSAPTGEKVARMPPSANEPPARRTHDVSDWKANPVIPITAHSRE